MTFACFSAPEAISVNFSLQRRGHNAKLWPRITGGIRIFGRRISPEIAPADRERVGLRTRPPGAPGMAGGGNPGPTGDYISSAPATLDAVHSAGDLRVHVLPRSRTLPEARRSNYTGISECCWLPHSTRKVFPTNQLSRRAKPKVTLDPRLRGCVLLQSPRVPEAPRPRLD